MYNEMQHLCGETSHKRSGSLVTADEWYRYVTTNHYLLVHQFFQDEFTTLFSNLVLFSELKLIFQLLESLLAFHIFILHTLESGIDVAH